MFYTDIVTKIDNECLNLIQNAEHKKFKTWRETVDRFQGIRSYLRKHHKLSNGQLDIIKNGLEQSNLPVPDYLEDRTQLRVKRPKSAPATTHDEFFGEPTIQHGNVTITKAQWDECVTKIALELGDQMFEVLRANGSDVH